MAWEIVDVAPGTGIDGSNYGIVDTNDFNPPLCDAVGRYYAAHRTDLGVHLTTVPQVPEVDFGDSSPGAVLGPVDALTTQPWLMTVASSPGDYIGTMGQTMSPSALPQHFPPGTHLRSTRGLYAHDGIQAYNGLIVNLTGDARKDVKTATVRLSTPTEFSDGHGIRPVSHAGEQVFPPDLIVQRALSRLGEPGYDLFSNNCEHFANWCVTGEPISTQVRVGVGTGVGLAILALALIP